MQCTTAPATFSRLMGADSRIVPDGFDIGIRKSWEDAIQSVKDAGGKPYPIPAGASVHKYGGLGYVGFAEEVRAQEKQMAVSRATWRRRRPARSTKAARPSTKLPRGLRASR